MPTLTIQFDLRTMPACRASVSGIMQAGFARYASLALLFPAVNSAKRSDSALR